MCYLLIAVLHNLVANQKDERWWNVAAVIQTCSPTRNHSTSENDFFGEERSVESETVLSNFQ